MPKTVTTDQSCQVAMRKFRRSFRALILKTLDAGAHPDCIMDAAMALVDALGDSQTEVYVDQNDKFFVRPGDSRLQ